MTMTESTPSTISPESPTDEPDPTLMRGATQDRYGSSDVIRIETMARPTPGPNDVLIEVHAAGVDRGTEHLMTGTPYLIRILGFGFRRPKQRVLGLDVAGTVVAVGAEVTRFRPGDAVYGIARGSFAEYALADEKKLAHKPETITYAQAATSAVSGITALQALTDVGGLQPGQRVLVIGASGGVGTFAVQLAVALGATVDGIAGPANQDFVRSLGATRVFDHRTVALADIDERYDLVIDTGGRNPLRALRSVLTDTGTLVIVGGEGGNRLTGGIGRQLRAVLWSPFVSHTMRMFMSTEHHAFMDRLSEHLASGAVVPAIGHHFDLDDAAAALRLYETGEAKGKSAIVVRPGAVA